MSPDIHWHVGEDKDQETIAHASAPRHSRRSWIAILIVVILGVGLGAMYRSIPEPAPRPTPSPSPTPIAIPAALYQVIDREAQALADGDFETYRNVHAASMQDRVVGEYKSFTAWGRPSNDRPVYEVVDFNLLSDTSAWVDIRQFREGRYFRETRFYYPASDRWLHGTPNDALWNGEKESLQTPHFNVTYPVKDYDVLSHTLNHLEEDYQSLCRDLGCAALGHELTFTVRLIDDENPNAYPRISGGEIWMPSPRVAGFYESGRAYDWNNNPVHWILAQAIADRVYGTDQDDRPGGGLMWAGCVWAVEHIDPLAAEYFDKSNHLTPKSPLSLEILWEIGRVESASSALIQLNRLLRFVEQEYGAAAVTRLLGAVSSAKSMPDAIENSLDMPFADFDQKLKAWARQNIPKQ